MNFSINMTYDNTLPYEARIDAIKDAGFTHAFLWWDQNDPDRFVQPEYMRRRGLVIETAHLQFAGINDMWLDNASGAALAEAFLKSIDESRDCGIPTVILHLTSGFNPPPVSDIGTRRFRAICERAEKYGVAVAFENLRRTSYLDYILSTLSDLRSARFCFDCGHENLYNHGVGVLEAHADRLSALHLHDNFGLSDDHMLPFDARIDWRGMAQRLKDRIGTLPLTLEVNLRSADREDYASEGFLTEALKRAKLICQLIEES